MLNESMGQCYSNDLSDSSDDDTDGVSSLSTAAKGTRLFDEKKNEITRPTTKKNKMGAIADAILKVGKDQDSANDKIADAMVKMAAAISGGNKENNKDEIDKINERLNKMEELTAKKFDKMDNNLNNKCNDINTKLALILESLQNK